MSNDLQKSYNNHPKDSGNHIIERSTKISQSYKTKIENNIDIAHHGSCFTVKEDTPSRRNKGVGSLTNADLKQILSTSQNGEGSNATYTAKNNMTNINEYGIGKSI